MDRINGSAVSVDLFGAGKDGFKDGDKANGIPATIVTAEFLNSIQEEVANVIEGAGITLDVNNRTQLKQAISVMLAGANTIARFTTTGNITLSGLATQAGGDWGGALTAGDVILVKNQATASQNGWYAAAAGAWTRVVYLDESEEVKPSTLTKVSEGATLADTMWMLTTDAPITVGATNLIFTPKGDGLELTDFTGSNQSLSASGYQKLPGGLIIQWGAGSHGSATGATSISPTFPIAFPNAAFHVGVSNFVNPTDALFFAGNSLSATGFSGSLYDVELGPVTTGDFFYLAIGY
ncbi:MAG: gp53-like domain-containing protein [Methylophilaceae bacterium]